MNMNRSGRLDRIDRQGMKNLKDRLHLTVMCGSCGAVLQSGDPKHVTHGICPPCYEELMKTVVSHGLATEAEAEASLDSINVAEAERESQPTLF